MTDKEPISSRTEHAAACTRETQVEQILDQEALDHFHLNPVRHEHSRQPLPFGTAFPITITYCVDDA